MVARPCDESPDDGRAFGRLRDRVEREKGFQRPAGTAAETVVALGEVRTGVAALERVHVCGLNLRREVGGNKETQKKMIGVERSTSPRPSLRGEYVFSGVKSAAWYRGRDRVGTRASVWSAGACCRFRRRRLRYQRLRGAAPGRRPNTL